MSVEAERICADAEVARQARVRDAHLAAREEALALRAEAEAVLCAREAQLIQTQTALGTREVALDPRALAEGRARLAERERPVAAVEARTAAHRREADQVTAEVRTALARAIGEPVEAVMRALADREVEEARAGAAQQLRAASEGATPSEQVRCAKRLMGIAVGRFAGHYLTERHQSLVPVGKTPPGDDDLRAIEAVAKVTLTLTEGAVRIEGLDGVGREIARRALRRPGAVQEIAADLEREILELGRRAFATLEINRAHPDIVRLVGQLNFRTSYTQNQWKHAIEAAFLGGMIADELGLDRKLARRAALMHDIGKALTHELDGSHAVIGADYARRLGEAEVVANAIGAHHTDEPFNSPYAYLVAAADAMSGARPGARRQSEDNHTTKLADLERLTRGFPGVEEAFAVQGGREVRVYVREDRVDDLGAVNLSSRIAETISRELTFPGQIKVTVIRELCAVETAS